MKAKITITEHNRKAKKFYGWNVNVTGKKYTFRSHFMFGTKKEAREIAKQWIIKELPNQVNLVK